MVQMDDVDVLVGETLYGNSWCRLMLHQKKSLKHIKIQINDRFPYGIVLINLNWCPL